ncbi:MAG: Na/Pi cotransporter family protein [Clostridia bacterium]|nr:Na/Pi cotransporter family protein [Clostridia bacterium]
MNFGELGTAESAILLLVGIGVFLLGFKFLGDNIQKLSAAKMRNLFNKAVANRFAGVGVGALATAIFQSSAVTTVMVVGFVNAGVMTLTQAAAVIMGANIGTTITGWLVWLDQFDVMLYAMLLTLVGLVMTMVCKKNKFNTSGILIASLGLVFVGLEIMSGSMSGLASNGAIKTALQSVTNPVLLLLIGAGVTAIVQSSSAVTSVLVVMAQAGLLVGGGGNGILFVIMGTNIGSCVTSIISSFGANTNAKRACLYHLLFNVIGTLIIFPFVCIFDGFYDMLYGWFGGNDTTCITFFHTTFNVLCTAIYLPFVKYLVKLCEIIIPDRKKKNKKATASEGYMDPRFLNTPSIAIGQLVKQTTYTAGVAVKSLNAAFETFINQDETAIDGVKQDIEKVNSLSKEITEYLIEVSAKEVSLNDEKIINRLHGDNISIVRIADIADNILGYTGKVVEEGLNFSDIVKADLRKMMNILNEQYELVVNIVENNDVLKIKQSDELEDDIDACKKQLLADHMKRMTRGECSPENNSLFVSLVSNIERAADHLSIMAHSLEDK